MLSMTCTFFNYIAKLWVAKHHKVDWISAENVAGGMLHVEFCRAAIRRTFISFKDCEYGVQLRSLPQHLAGTGTDNKSVNRRMVNILCNFGL